MGLSESILVSLIYYLFPKNRDLTLTPVARPGQFFIHLFAISKHSAAAAEKDIVSLSKMLHERLGKGEGDSLACDHDLGNERPFLALLQLFAVSLGQELDAISPDVVASAFEFRARVAEADDQKI